MNKISKNQEEEPDPFKPAADILFNYLYDLIYHPATVSLDIKSLPKAFHKFGRGLEYLGYTLSEMRTFAKELAGGNLNCTAPKATNEIASSLKMLQASLRHLTWQAQQVALGDYNQRVDFMGDFSRAFNNMIEQLKQRHKTSLEEKQELQMYVQLLLTNSPNPILLFDLNRQLVYASDSCIRYFNTASVDEIIGKNIQELLVHITSVDTVDIIMKLYDDAILENCTKEIEQEIKYLNADYSYFFKIEITPMLDANSSFRGVMLFLINVTESVYARRETEKAWKLAEQSLRSKSIFLAKMSHEIRTPMNAIIGMSELAMRGNIQREVQEYILTIRQAGINLLSIINDILDFSKIETGKIEIIQEYYSVASLINDVVSIIRMRVIDSNIRFVVYIDNEIPGILLGDEARIRQVLLNLINNAVKYTKNGFVSFTVLGEKINDSTIKIIFEVMDSGIGIKQNDINKLFDEFTQFDSEEHYIEGTGLGLAITRSIVEEMNGSINVQSEYGLGSIFTVTLPQKYTVGEKLAFIKNPEKMNALICERRLLYANSIFCSLDSLGIYCDLASTVSELSEKIKNNTYSFIFISCELFENAAKWLQKLPYNTKIVQLTGFGEAISDKNLSTITMPVHSIAIANNLNGISVSYNYNANSEIMTRFIAPAANVLVVDDITTNLKVAEGLLLPYKMQLDMCKSGITAVEMVKTKRYDLVFMDHMMPKMSGIEATELIRALGNEDLFYKTMPIIALTANAVSGTKEMFLQNGFNDFLSKPIDTMQLDTILERWIPRGKQINPTEKESPDRGMIGNGKSDAVIIEGLNTAKGIAMTGGTLKQYLKTLEVFIKDGKEKIEEIETCLKTNNISLYSIYVHALKSALGNIGAEGLSEAAKALETAGKQEDMDFIKNHNAAFIRELKKILKNIDKYIQESIGEEQVQTTDRGVLREELTRLKTALEALDPAEIHKAVNELHRFTRSIDKGPEIMDILNQVLIGEYDGAAVLIDSSLETI